MNYNKITSDNLENMSFDELKDVARFYSIKIGNISEDKLREKMKNVINENVNTDAIADGLNDDLTVDSETDTAVVEETPVRSSGSKISDNLKSISESIDELDESASDDDFEVVEPST